MKKAFFKTSLPLTIIFFFLFSKIWLVSIDDIGCLYLYGFPFIQSSKGFHTSMSTQFFILEFLANFLCYLIIITVGVYYLKKVFPLRKSKILSIAINFSALFILGLFIYFLTLPDNRVVFKRDFKINTVKKTSFGLIHIYRECKD